MTIQHVFNLGNYIHILDAVRVKLDVHFIFVLSIMLFNSMSSFSTLIRSSVFVCQFACSVYYTVFKSAVVFYVTSAAEPVMDSGIPVPIVIDMWSWGTAGFFELLVSKIRTWTFIQSSCSTHVCVVGRVLVGLTWLSKCLSLS